MKRAHRLKRKSSFIVVILRSLQHGACVCCSEPIGSLEESAAHWEKELAETVNREGKGGKYVRGD